MGILLASRLGQGTPVVGSGYELWAIAATVSGGTASSAARALVPAGFSVHRVLWYIVATHGN